MDMDNVYTTPKTNGSAQSVTSRKSYGPGPRIAWKMTDLDRFNHNMTRIVALMDHNPKISGAAHQLWVCYLGEPTVAEFFRNAREIADKGKVRADIRYNLERGFIKLVDLNGRDYTPSS